MATTNRQQMIDNVRRFWIDGVLDNSLHGAVLMQLGLQDQPEQVQRPWEVKIRRDGEDRSLSHDTRIIDVFDYSGGSLLVLGEPGSGKTTLLLELTRDLLDRAELQPEYRLPIVLNLSSWAKDKLPFDDWLVEELNIKYQVARTVAEAWVAQQSFLLLLDGLDEVSESVRDDCVDEINAYHRQHPVVPMVVCSRTQDYATLSKKLDFHDAVMIEPLDDRQIDGYLTSFGDSMNGLRGQLATDRRLRGLAETPLTLSIMTLAYQGVDTATLPDGLSLDVQRKHLFETYINTMFDRHSKSHDQKPEEVIGYLSWLAGRMVERRQTLFHIENLQWDWLETRKQQSLFKLFGRTAYGTIIGAIAGGLAMFVGMILTVVIIGGDVQFYQGRNGAQYGLHALLLYTAFGSLFGILAGGVPFGLTGLIAFSGDRLSIKGYAKSYKARTATFSVLISLFSSMVGSIVLMLMMMVLNGDISTYGRHFYELGAYDRLLEGFEAIWWYTQVSLLMGIISGMVSVSIAIWWHKREGRIRQVITGVAGFLIGGIYMLAIWIFYISYRSSSPDFSEMLFPTLVIALFTGGLGILTGGFRDRIESAESIGWRWNWRWAKVGLAVALVIVGLDFLSMQTWSYPSDNYLTRAITFFLPMATLCVLTGGIAAGLRKNEKVESRTQPNQGVRRSAKTALKITGAFSIVGVIIGLISMATVYGAEFINNGFTLVNLSEWEIEQMMESFRSVVILGVSSGIVAGLILGGTDTVVKHLVLRLMLWRNADIPMNLAKLLDHATDLILLRKVGGGYIFVHRYLLEHFATIEE